MSEEDLGNITEETVRHEYQRALTEQTDGADLSQYLVYLWLLYANFHLMIVAPHIEAKNPPVFISPDYDEKENTYESVYTIVDHGYAFSTSRGEDAALGSTAMGKLYRTIQKMIRLFIARVAEVRGGGGEANEEIKVALFGHELGRRKAFALIMNEEKVNVNVVNFDPVAWGERFIENLKYMVTSGHGAPLDLQNVVERVVPSS